MMYAGDEDCGDEITSGMIDEPEEPEAYQEYYLTTEADGTITGTTTTNDDNDDGYPDGDTASWNVKFRDYADMLKRTGGSHYGCSGIRVYVELDGKEVKKQ